MKDAESTRAAVAPIPFEDLTFDALFDDLKGRVMRHISHLASDLRADGSRGQV
jgi:hypothetical protein